MDDEPNSRVETGPIQFGDDWPGVFIRGDNAFDLLGGVRRAIEFMEKHPKSGWDIITIRQLEGLCSLLESAIMGPHNPTPQVRKMGAPE